MDTEKKENKEVNKLSLLIVAVIVLVLIIAGAGYYIYHQKQQMTDLVETFDLEKESLEDEYNELSLQYEKEYLRYDILVSQRQSILSRHVWNRCYMGYTIRPRIIRRHHASQMVRPLSFYGCCLLQELNIVRRADRR